MTKLTAFRATVINVPLSRAMIGIDFRVLFTPTGMLVGQFDLAALSRRSEEEVPRQCQTAARTTNGGAILDASLGSPPDVPISAAAA